MLSNITVTCVPYSHQILPPRGAKIKGSELGTEIGGAKIKGSELVTEIWGIQNFRVSILNLVSFLKLSFRSKRGAKNKRSIRGAKINGSKFDSSGAKIKGSEI